MLFDIIDKGNWIPDELHTLLRILDILLQCTFYELTADKKEFEKTKILIINEMKRISIAKFFNQNRRKDIEYLWHKFYKLYKIIRQQYLTDVEIDSFENNAKQWVRGLPEIS
ncbi:hypothetical protein C2G38_2174191 [Gigaspora rosea]|uniref:Uncharacterized protein n=1 Tax=Gigaspora rosea TaxID=44941 RepID=A0A397VK34_9GLOM|nr:hypothetical protein C2G38_2174191 [Gigaspora rosea]